MLIDPLPESERLRRQKRVAAASASRRRRKQGLTTPVLRVADGERLLLRGKAASDAVAELAGAEDLAAATEAMRANRGALPHVNTTVPVRVDLKVRAGRVVGTPETPTITDLVNRALERELNDMGAPG